MSGTPSMAAGTSRPCQWIEVGTSVNWFSTRMRSVSPSRTRTSGPGTWPPATTAGTTCAPSGLIEAEPTTMSNCVAFGFGTYAGTGPGAARATRPVTSAVVPTAVPRRTVRREIPRGGSGGGPTSRRPSAMAVLLLVGLAASALQPACAWGRHLARGDPTEPIFTQRAFVEKNVELDSGWDRVPGSDGVELAPGVSWVFWKRLELDLEMPIGLAIPEHGPTVGS